jgi:hypothetical protein
MHNEQIDSITSELESYEAQLYAASVEYRSLIQDAATKRAAYDVAYAQELLKVPADMKLTVPKADALVVSIVADQLTACRIAEAMADGAKRHLTALQSNLTSIQTRASLLKTERSLLNMMT